MMADFDLMELAPEQEDLAYLHQQLFSTATEVVTAGGGEPPMIVTETATANVDLVHDVIDFSGKYGNGNTAPETTETEKTEKPAVYHGEGEALVGRSIVKKFKRTKYAGKIISFDAELKWYKVEYEDGDEEELEYKEIEALLVEAGEAEAVRAANAKKKSQPEPDSDSKSPAKRGRGRPPGVKTPAKAKAEKKASAPKSPKTPKIPKVATPKKPSPKKTAGGGSEEKKTPSTGEKRGRGRPRKDGSAAKPKASGDSSSESKPSTRKAASSQDQGESRTGRSPRGKAVASPSAGGTLLEKEGVQLIGTKTKKEFHGKLYDGEVIAYDPKLSYYKVLYSDGDKEDLTLKEVRATRVDGQTTPKTRGRSKSADPAKSGEESPTKKQKVSTPKKDAAKAQSPARDGSQPRKRGRPAKAKR